VKLCDCTEPGKYWMQRPHWDGKLPVSIEDRDGILYIVMSGAKPQPLDLVKYALTGAALEERMVL